MWLIDIHTGQLHEFEAPIPPYAILSHRWSLEELNFKEVYKKRIDTTKKGYVKLVGACRVAAGYGVHYLWLDTCCIDKKSSAELSEAINSMFTWYQNAEVCLAYLEDVISERAGRPFEKSVWFRRAWTLQELLAPKGVVFYNRFWTIIADKSSDSLEIETITNIPHDVLTGLSPLSDWSFAARMSWASERQATRIEDIAYSLMGIFDIHMPLLYGEGKRSFVRLQEEIIRKSDGPDFLLWGLEQKTSNLLASSPADFDSTRSGHLHRSMYFWSITLTSLGLETETDLFKCGMGLHAMRFSFRNDFLLILEEVTQGSSKFNKVCLISQNLSINGRIWSGWYAKKQKIIIMKEAKQGDKPVSLADRKLLFQPYSVEIRCSRPLSIQTTRSLQEKEDKICSPSMQSVSLPGKSSLLATWLSPILPGVARMECHTKSGYSLLLEFTFDFYYHPCLLVRPLREAPPLTGHKNPTVQQICQKYPPKPYDNFLNKGWLEVKSREITEADHPCYLVQGTRFHRSCAEIPPKMTNGLNIWVFFAPADQNYPWRMAVSDKPDPHMANWRKLFT